MTASSHRACRWPGCPELILQGEKYCRRHQRRGTDLDQERAAAFEASYRQSPAAQESDRFLRSAAWLAMRKTKLEQDPFCERHAWRGQSILATDVHHREARAARPDLALELSNLESLCHRCHSQATMAETRGR